VRNEGDLSSAPAQNVTVNVADDSPMFAVVTLLFYIFIFPIGLLLNLVGLFTGPRRGCFLTMLILFVVVPAIVIFGILGLTVPEVIEAIAKFIKDFGNS
jgi:hypothetical membrane protein